MGISFAKQHVAVACGYSEQESPNRQQSHSSCEHQQTKGSKTETLPKQNIHRNADSSTTASHLRQSAHTKAGRCRLPALSSATWPQRFRRPASLLTSSALSELRAQKYTLRVLRSDALRALLGRHCATGCSKSHVRTRPAPQPRAAFNELRSGKLRLQGREPPGPSPDIPNFLPAVPPKRRGALLPEAAVLKRRGSAPSRAEPASPRDAPGTLRPRRAARTPDGGGRPSPIVPAALHHGDILYRLRDSLLSKQPGSESWGCAPS